jgi:subfamily B ATP-binding cassette protein MsbA
MSTSKQVWSRLWSYIHPDKRFLLLGIVCSCGVAAMSIATMSMIGNLFDAMERHAMRQLNLVCAAVIGFYGLRWFFTYGQTVFFAEAGQRLALRLRNDVYGHLQGLSIGFFNRQRTGALMSTINNDVPLLMNTVSGLKDFAQAPFLVAGSLAYAFWISPPLTVAALFVIPFMAYAINHLTRLIRQVTGRTQDKLADVNTLMEETLSGIRIIQSFSAEKLEISRFRHENQNAKDLSMSVVRQQARVKPTVDLIGALGVAGALWIGGHLVLSGGLDLKNLIKFIAMLNQVAVGVNGFGAFKIINEQLQAGGRRIMDNVLLVKSDIQEIASPTVLDTVSGEIVFHEVHFSYNPDTPVLRGITFHMNPGEVIAVVGPSGAGKSTIADLIPRFYDPQAGCVFLDGHDLRTLSLESLRRQIGIVPQETILFGGTIRDNIAYGDPNATQEMIEAAACAANAHDFISNPRILPEGYDTLVGERGKQLSGGQRQRIAIARALLKNPRILILDEATSSLDAASEILVQEALEKLMQGRTTLVIAHRLSTIINADRILVLQSGRIAESGTHGELIRRPGGIYAQLYETQFRWDGDSRPEPAVVAAS